MPTAPRLISKCRSTGRATRSRNFAAPKEEIAQSASALGPADLQNQEALDSKFGPLPSSPSRPRRARRAAASALCAPMTIRMLQLSGWFCQGGDVCRALDARLRARPADVARRRQRAQSRRAIRPGRTQPQLSAASAIRLSPRRRNTRCCGRRSPLVPNRAASAADFLITGRRHAAMRRRFPLYRPQSRLTGRENHPIIFE